MEDLESLDVLKRAKKLNPEVSIMVVSADGNAAFPLEAYQIEVDDYLLLPITPGELVRRVEPMSEKVAELKRAKEGAKLRGVLQPDHDHVPRYPGFPGVHRGLLEASEAG